MTRRPRLARAARIVLITIGCIVAWLLAALILMTSVEPVAAHSWYHHECCNDRDCFPLAHDAVRETPQGYLLVETGRIIPYSFGKFRVSQDDHFHLCTTAGDPMGDILCFYRPPASF
jgi:hypothetical protein